MSDDNKEMQQQGYGAQLHAVIEQYIPWFRTGKEGGLTSDEVVQLEEKTVVAVEDFNNAVEGLSEHATDDDKRVVEKVVEATKQLDGSSAEGVQTWMEFMQASFDSFSEGFKAVVIKPFCNLFKAIGDVLKQAYRATADYSFFNTEEKSDEETEGHEDSEDNRPDPDKM